MSFYIKDSHKREKKYLNNSGNLKIKQNDVLYIQRIQFIKSKIVQYQAYSCGKKHINKENFYWRKEDFMIKL